MTCFCSAADEATSKRLRTARERTTPLQWWKGERPILSRVDKNGTTQPVNIVQAWLRLPDDDPISFAATRSRKVTRGRGRSSSVKASKENGVERDWEERREGEDVRGWDDKTEPSGITANYSDGTDHMRSKSSVPKKKKKRRRGGIMLTTPNTTRSDTHPRSFYHTGVACTENNLAPTGLDTASFKYQKVFGEDEFFAAGVLYVEVGGCKTPKNSKDNAYVSYS